VSKIVIGALTAAVWFALCYVARAEGMCGHETGVTKYAECPVCGPVIRGTAIEMAR
jgi:hypothetical protein